VLLEKVAVHEGRNPDGYLHPLHIGFLHLVRLDLLLPVADVLELLVEESGHTQVDAVVLVGGGIDIHLDLRSYLKITNYL
jgi:hypothetical protein